MDATPSAASNTMGAAEFDSLFAEAYQAHELSESRSAVAASRRHVRIAGQTLTFRFSNPVLEAAVFPAFAHLAVNPVGDPAFEICVTDEETSGAARPFSHWSGIEAAAGGEAVHYIGDDRMLQVVQPFRLVAAARRDLRRAVLWLASVRRFEAWERASPFPVFFNWWGSTAGFVKVHAAAVGRADGGVLIVAPSGSGKSHTAISCLQSDLLYAGDDYCLLGTAGPPTVASLYSTGKLYMRDVHRFPYLEEHAREAIRTDEDKAIFFVNDILPEKLVAGFPVRAVLIPRVSGRADTAFSPASPIPALLHLGPESALRGGRVGRRAFAGIAAALRSCPCFHLETGTDVESIPRAITRLLDSLAP